MNKYDILAVVLSPTAVAAFTIFTILRGHSELVEWTAATLNIVVGPVLPVILLAASKKTDLSVSDQSQRTPLLAIAILSYFMGFTFFHLRNFWDMEFVTLSYGMVTIGVASVNAFYTKGSIHMAGITGPSVILILLGRKEGIYLLSLISLVAWIRLKVGAHSWSQIVVGGAVAVILTLFTYFICLVSLGA